MRCVQISNPQSAISNSVVCRYDFRMRRIISRVALALIVLVVLAGAGGYLYLRRSLPAYNEDQVVAGLSGPVDIVRDADAIPHIFASNKLCLLYTSPSPRD